MGIVKKQVYKNTLVTYAGMAVAYVNTILLFPFFATNEQYGLYNLLISLSVLYSLIASLGIPGIVAKYFPFYRTDDGSHNGFVHWTAIIAAAGFIILTVLLIVFKPFILSKYIDTSPLFVKYYYYLIPLSLFTILFNFLEVTGRVVYRTIFSSFLRDVLIRLITTFLLIMLAEHWISFHDFIALYVASWGLVALILLISLYATKKFSYRLGATKFNLIKKKEILYYGFYTTISLAIYVLLQKVDVIMLSSMVGDAIQGVYSWYFNIAIAISVPAQALSRTTYQLVADSWKSKNLKNIEDIYVKTSIIQMVIGCLIFILIIINKNNLLSLVHDKIKAEQFNVVILIGLGFLVDITGGLNSYIIVTSHKYRIITMVTILSSIFCVGLNYLLIPKYGGMGAAFAYLVTMIVLNFCTWLYTKIRFNMQPFSYKHVLVIVIAFISYMVGKFLWRAPNLYFDMLLRTGVTALLYIGFAYWLKISEDLNEKVKSLFLKWIYFKRT